MLGQPFLGDEKAKEDSHSLLPLLQGQEDDALRDRTLINHSYRGVFAIRHGSWKLILSDTSGGFSDFNNPDGYGIQTEGQLFNLADDLQEQNNLYAERPDKVEELSSSLEKVK